VLPVLGGGVGQHRLLEHRAHRRRQREPAVAQAVPVVGDREPARFLDECFLAFEGHEFVLLGDLGGHHFEDVVGEPAQRDRVVLGGQADQVGFGLAAVLDRQRVHALDDHHRLLLGHGAGGHRVPDRLVVPVQRVRELQAALRVPLGLSRLVGPVAAGVRGPGLSAEVEAVGVLGDPELELGEPVPQRGHRGEGLGQFGLGHRPQSWVAELVEVGVESCDQGRDRVRFWFAEYRCHTGNSGIEHRQSWSGNGVFRAAVEKYSENFLGSWMWWFRDGAGAPR
jgi:hypothetical protein